MSEVTVHLGDCRDVLKTLADCSVDSIVTDPPYALVSIGKRFGQDGAAPAKSGKTGAYARASAGFMGQAWDTGEVAHDPAFWAECLRVLKPGGHLVAFSGTRTQHRQTCAIEDAGFEIRDGLIELIATDTHAQRFFASLNEEQRRAFVQMVDESQFGGMLAWIYGSGFPKSHDVSKGIDRANGDERPVVGDSPFASRKVNGSAGVNSVGLSAAAGSTITSAASAASAAWEGWGTALKPALEPICLARKPLQGTVAANVLAHGTGALNIDACRISADENLGGGDQSRSTKVKSEGWDRPWMHDEAAKAAHAAQVNANVAKAETLGRWPANVVLDGSAEVVEAFPTQAGAGGPVRGTEPSAATTGIYGELGRVAGTFHNDSGSASRFFYSAKADAGDRMGSAHPTVKPISLMAWLVRLVTPPRGLVLDPFAGSGSTGMACLREDFDAILIERDPKFHADIVRKIAWARGEGRLTALEAAHSKLDETKAAGLDLPLFAEDAA